MAIYMVGYDLHEGENYSDLIKELQSFSKWWHCLDSTWLIESNLTATQVRDRLWQHMKADDRLLVAYYLPGRQGGAAAWQGFANMQCANWLQQNL